MDESAKTTECRCPYCDAEIDEPPAFCAPCEVVVINCVHCGEPVRQDLELCPHCGEAPR